MGNQCRKGFYSFGDLKKKLMDDGWAAHPDPEKPQLTIYSLPGINFGHTSYSMIILPKAKDETELPYIGGWRTGTGQVCFRGDCFSIYRRTNTYTVNEKQIKCSGPEAKELLLGFKVEKVVPGFLTENPSDHERLDDVSLVQRDVLGKINEYEARIRHLRLLHAKLGEINDKIGRGEFQFEQESEDPRSEDSLAE